MVSRWDVWEVYIWAFVYNSYTNACPGVNDAWSGRNPSRPRSTMGSETVTQPCQPWVEVSFTENRPTRPSISTAHWTEAPLQSTYNKAAYNFGHSHAGLR